MSALNIDLFAEEPRSHFSDDSSSIGPPSSPIQVAVAARAQMAIPAMVLLQGTSNQAPLVERERAATPSDVSWRTATPPPIYELQPESSPTSPCSPAKRKGDSGTGSLVLAAANAALVKRGYQPYPMPAPKLPEVTPAMSTEEAVEQEVGELGPHRSKRRGIVTKVAKTRKWADKVPKTTPDANRAYDQALKSIKADLAEAKKAIDRATPGPSKAPRRSLKVPKPIIPLSCLASVLSRRRNKP